ncbi:cyclin-like protein [Roridomyces roridus]|uniref:Cyclin-like protein n=1 Tax=Roridomyces roridus TaxID=1738132 RepID=A0AAD7FDY8_9AGAR|nr:cyclin-like protein [Roridomyces roridus]
MATDFWSSSHYKRWIVDRATLRQARADDLLYIDDAEHLDFLAIYFAEIIGKLGKKMQIPQRVIATATVFFRRFYLKNSYCETDPFMVIAACIYVAAKAEEFPVHIKHLVSDARHIFSQQYGVKNFPSDNSKLAEMEFYLVDDLECDLTVFHPYRTLLALCKSDASDDSSTPNEEEAGELGVGITADDGPRYWGTGEGQLELPPNGLQTAWFIVNDTYRSELCLLYPPHLIAIAAIYLTCIFHPATQETVSALLAASGSEERDREPPVQQPRRSSRQAAERKKPAQDPLAFLAELNVSLPLIATIAQEIIAMYTLWERYKEDGSADSGSTPDSRGGDDEAGSIVTVAQLTSVLLKMREARLQDIAHPSGGRPAAVNKMLERTQAAG